MNYRPTARPFKAPNTTAVYILYEGKWLWIPTEATFHARSVQWEQMTTDSRRLKFSTGDNCPSLTSNLALDASRGTVDLLQRSLKSGTSRKLSVLKDEWARAKRRRSRLFVNDSAAVTRRSGDRIPFALHPSLRR